MRVAKTVKSIADDTGAFLGHDLLFGGEGRARLIQTRASVRARIIFEPFGDGLQPAQAVPDMPRRDRAQVGPQGMRALPLTEHPKLIAPEVYIDVLRQIIDEHVGHATTHATSAIRGEPVNGRGRAIDVIDPEPTLDALSPSRHITTLRRVCRHQIVAALNVSNGENLEWPRVSKQTCLTAACGHPWLA